MKIQRLSHCPVQVFLFLLFSSLVLSQAVSGQTDPFPTASPESQGVEPSVLGALTGLVEEWVEEDRIVGAELLVIKNGRAILHRPFGLRDREQQLVMERNTVFNIRSMTKPLVGMAILMLVEDGQLSLEDRVATVLPAFRHDGAARITVDQLLTHRSGLPVSLAFDPGNRGQNLHELAAVIGAAGPESEPGTRFNYSDAGANVLAALVEEVSGLTLDEFLRSRVFGPLHMDDTDFLTQVSGRGLPMERIATLYGGASGAWQRFWGPDEDPVYAFPMGSQSVFTTPVDYARLFLVWLDRGLFAGRAVLSEESIRRILTPLSLMTLIGSEQPYPTAFPGLEVWHGRMALLFRSPDSPADVPPVAFGYAGSDGHPRADGLQPQRARQRRLDEVHAFRPGGCPISRGAIGRH